MKTFFCEPTGQCRRFLRRYSRADLDGDGKCGGWSYHAAMTPIDDLATVYSTDERGRRSIEATPGRPDDFTGDPRWPTRCERCDYHFTPEDHWQVFSNQLYRRDDTGAILTLRELNDVPGAMWDAWWYPVKGPDGRSLIVICPDRRQWMIDSRASNCTMKDGLLGISC